MLTKNDISSHIYFTIIWGIFTFVAYIICFRWLDIPVANWFHHTLKGTMLFKFGNLISTIFDPKIWTIVAIITLLISIYFLFIAKKQQQAKNWLFVAVSLIIAIVIALIFKYGLARYRPIELFNHNLYGFHFLSMKSKFNSTPSGHATLAFAGLLSIALCFKKRIWFYLAIILAIIITISRLIVTKHYLGDVIFGAYIGIFSYYWGILLCNKYLSHINHKLNKE